MLKEGGTDRMKVFWSGKAALKSTSKTGLPAKSQFETYRAENESDKSDR